MPVDFYILRESSAAARLKVACRLVEQAYARGERVLVRLESEQELGEFDQMLWTFADRAFVPHDRLTAEAAAADFAAPVALTAGELPKAIASWPVLVDLALALPGASTLPGHVIEIIDADETRRRQGRDRFRAYRDAGHTPNTLHWDNENPAANG